MTTGPETPAAIEQVPSGQEIIAAHSRSDGPLDPRELADKRGRRRLSAIWHRVSYTRSGKVGAVMAALLLLLIIFGPLFAPHTTTESIGVPFVAPSPTALLGTDVLGRDVLSRFLSGGRVILIVAFVTSLIAYSVGGVAGLIAGYRRGATGHSIVWVTDVFLSIPAIVVALAIIAALGPGIPKVAIAITVVLIPGIIRFVRIVTLEVSTNEYVEAAVARGERTMSVILHEILPNIRTPVSADFGIRLSWSIILYASLSFLGFGASPPSPDWGVMISENRVGLTVSPWPVLVPAIAIATLAVSVNLIADSVARSMGSSIGSGR